jgi:hypothetical protein
MAKKISKKSKRSKREEKIIATRPFLRIRVDPEETPEPAMKAFWGVYNTMMVKVAQFDYSDKITAQKTADELTKKEKIPHFVKLVKKVIKKR